ncbi:MAG: acyl dehydratase [Halioglobus sp.]|jgi:acyl dehydratase
MLSLLLYCLNIGYHLHSRTVGFGELFVPQLCNYTYDEIQLGQTARYSKTLELSDIQLFAFVSGDVNPVHLDEDFASTTPFKQRIAHGMLTGALISAALAIELPGPGTIYLGQSLRFRLPVMIGDTVTVHLEVTEKRDKRRMVTLECKAFNQHEKLVATGTAEVMAPSEKLSIDRPTLPQISIA